MKKIFLLMTMITSFLFVLSIDSKAISIYGTPGYDYYDNLTIHVPIDELNGLSLNELFYDYNLIELNSWIMNDGQLSLNYDTLQIIQNNNFSYVSQLNRIPNNYDGDKYYYFSSFEIINNTGGNNTISLNLSYSNTGNVETNGVINLSNALTGIRYRLSEIGEVKNTDQYFLSQGVGIYFRIQTTGTIQPYYSLNGGLINLTSLGINNLTKSQLDYFYNIYILLKNGLDPQLIYDIGYIHGFNYGNDFGYDSGYDDGLSDGYNNGYSDGYNNGYSDGQEDGYDTGYLDGNVAGLETGYLNGYNDGFDEGIISDVDTSWLLGFVSGTVNVLGISIIPGITLGVFVFIPLFFGFIGFIYRLGGRRG